MGDNYAGLTISGSSGVWTSGTSTFGQTLPVTEAAGTLVIMPEPGVLALAAVGIATAAGRLDRQWSPRGGPSGYGSACDKPRWTGGLLTLVQEYGSQVRR